MWKSTEKLHWERSRYKIRTKMGGTERISAFCQSTSRNAQGRQEECLLRKWNKREALQLREANLTQANLYRTIFGGTNLKIAVREWSASWPRSWPAFTCAQRMIYSALRKVVREWTS
jgi:hypothetical protein